MWFSTSTTWFKRGSSWNRLHHSCVPCVHLCRWRRPRRRWSQMPLRCWWRAPPAGELCSQRFDGLKYIRFSNCCEKNRKIVFSTGLSGAFWWTLKRLVLLFGRHQRVQRDEFVVLTCTEIDRKFRSWSLVQKTVTQTLTSFMLHLCSFHATFTSTGASWSLTGINGCRSWWCHPNLTADKADNIRTYEHRRTTT